MTIEDEAAVMRAIPIFAGIKPKRLKMLAAVCDRVSFAPGAELFHQGDVGDAAYVVISGTALVVTSHGGEEKLIARVGRHAIVGELAIICEIPRTATVRAETALETVRILREHFLLLLHEEPAAAIEVMRIIGKRLAERTR